MRSQRPVDAAVSVKKMRRGSERPYVFINRQINAERGTGDKRDVPDVRVLPLSDVAFETLATAMQRANTFKRGITSEAPDCQKISDA